MMLIPLTYVQSLIKLILSLVPTRVKVPIYSFLIRRWLVPTANPSIFPLAFGLVLKLTYERQVEADALRFVNKLQNVHAPHFIDFARINAQKGYLVSTWIHGVNVAEVWDDLTVSDKERIVEDLKDQVDSLQSQTISSRQEICNISGEPMEDNRIPWVYRENPRVFHSYPDFAQEVWIGLDWPRNEELAVLLRPFMEREQIPISLCHGDLLPWNIILPGGLESWRAGRSRLHLIDWAYAGWAPVEWDALKAVWMEELDDRWGEMCMKVFHEHKDVLEADWEWRKRSRVLIL